MNCRVLWRVTNACILLGVVLISSAVFVSYASEDANAAARIAQTLRSAGRTSRDTLRGQRFATSSEIPVAMLVVAIGANTTRATENAQDHQALLTNVVPVRLLTSSSAVQSAVAGHADSTGAYVLAHGDRARQGQQRDNPEMLAHGESTALIALRAGPRSSLLRGLRADYEKADVFCRNLSKSFAFYAD